jgi:hypothetical protein
LRGRRDGIADGWQKKPSTYSRAALTQSGRDVGDAFFVSDVVQTEDTVNFWEGNTVHVCGPFDSPLATEIDIVE